MTSSKDPMVVIGTDTALKDMLKCARHVSGVLAGGGNVIDLGMLAAPSDFLYYYTCGKADFGVVISASHNPPGIQRDQNF